MFYRYMYLSLEFLVFNRLEFSRLQLLGLCKKRLTKSLPSRHQINFKHIVLQRKCLQIRQNGVMIHCEMVNELYNSD